MNGFDRKGQISSSPSLPPIRVNGGTEDRPISLPSDNTTETPIDDRTSRRKLIFDDIDAVNQTQHYPRGAHD